MRKVREKSPSCPGMSKYQRFESDDDQDHDGGLEEKTNGTWPPPVMMAVLTGLLIQQRAIVGPAKNASASSSGSKNDKTRHELFSLSLVPRLVQHFNETPKLKKVVGHSLVSTLVRKSSHRLTAHFVQKGNHGLAVVRTSALWCGPYGEEEEAGVEEE